MSSNIETPVIGAEYQRFEFVDEKSSKFWEVRNAGLSVDVRYGKIGTAGQSQTKTFEDAAEAHKHAQKLVAEKLKGGYHTSGGVAPAPEKPTAVANSKALTLAPVKLAAPAKAAAPAVAKANATPEAKTAGVKTICISGKLPSGQKKHDYEVPLRAVGYELVDDVVHGLSYLVLADPASTSSKAEKARKMGIEVISEERLASLIAAGK